MTTDKTITDQTAAAGSLTNTHQAVQQSGQDTSLQLSEIDKKIEEYKKRIVSIEQEANQYMVDEKDRPHGLDSAIIGFSGSDPKCVNKSKDEIKLHRASALALGITLGFGTAAFTKYLLLGTLSSATPSLALISGIAVLGAVIYKFDRDLLKSIEEMSAKASRAFKEGAKDMEGSYLMFKSGLRSGDLQASFEGVKSGINVAALTGLGVIGAIRLAIIGGGATLMAVAAIDHTLLHDKVTAAAQAEFDLHMQVKDPGDGIETHVETIERVQGDVANLKTHLADLNAQKAALEHQLTGSVLSPQDQERISALNTKIAALEADKASALEKAAEFQGKIVSERDGGTGTVAGEGPKFRQARADAAAQIAIAESKSKIIASLDATKQSIIKTAQERFDSARDMQIEESLRTRLRTLDTEISTVNAELTKRADVTAFAQTDPKWQHFNPEGFERFGRTLEALGASGLDTKIIAAMVGGVLFATEAAALLKKWQDWGNPHASTVRELLAREFETYRAMKVGILNNLIAEAELEKTKIVCTSQDQKIELAARQAKLQHASAEAVAVQNQAMIERVIAALANPALLESLPDAEQTKHAALLADLRLQAERLAKTQVAGASLDTLRVEASLNRSKAEALDALAQSLRGAEEAALQMATGTRKTYNQVVVEVHNAQTALSKALLEIGDDPALQDLKTALKMDFDMRIAALATSLQVSGLRNTNDNLGGGQVAALQTLAPPEPASA